MFTGIIEAVEKIKSASFGKLEVFVPADWALAAGESVAVNGACLTVVSHKAGVAGFAVSPESFSRTTLGGLKSGSVVNLERALAVGARLGGHFVTGHIDRTARLLSVRDDGNSRIIEVEKSADAVMVEKGSVALDGISLTVYDVKPCSFKAAVIPHTWANTALKTLKPGAFLNVEYDILGKYASARPPGITRDFLKQNGFL
ncbi:MAG: riboflavin synthase subunit alpha [Elusimicrobia bacterium GWA2_62_23]|nr:MAG: riboflavin synthase subunit alpha [Elusimicrobia bacterium GWA2_62_23]OGR70021.1 MAG: riboflavin synthase subunit alpha [Elusimicrobia bacterium GWC2_63_65]